LKILFVAAEASPLIKIGGLADVVGSLPLVLRDAGHDVRLLLPQYACLDARQFPLTPTITGIPMFFRGENITFNLNHTLHAEVPVYTLENLRFFGGYEVYSSNDLDRFFFFSKAAFELLPHLDWQPDIVHCHDWHTALLVMFLKKSGYPYKSVFTIHNLAHQGRFDDNYLYQSRLIKYFKDLPHDAPKPPPCFMSQAILCAEKLTTVSETYAREITTPQMGMGLDALLRYRQDSLTGILNGLDYLYWAPQTDSNLAVNFNSGCVEKRSQNKAVLQSSSGLAVDEKAPLIGMVQRLDAQKGMDILLQSIEPVIQETGAQFIILGHGWEIYETKLLQLASRFPKNLAVFTAFEEPLAHRIYGGCDIFLMPSRFEPCGLGQMIAMRYGAVPVVRHTGGLVDTVPGFSPDLKKGHGFIFHEYSSAALLRTVETAVQAFKARDNWFQAVRRLMELDFSWQSSTRVYESLYRQLL